MSSVRPMTVRDDSMCQMPLVVIVICEKWPNSEWPKMRMKITIYKPECREKIIGIYLPAVILTVYNKTIFEKSALYKRGISLFLRESIKSNKSNHASKN